jgi:hypothetical protein
VCCDACAQKLNEADFSAHTAGRSGL